MFYQMSQRFKGDLKSLVGDLFSDEEFEAGARAMENLINIACDQSNFDREYGAYLNDSQLLSQSWDLDKGCKPEGMLRKIEILKGMPTDGKMLANFYTDLGFYRWLNEQPIRQARRNDPTNAANANNTTGEGFHLMTADASKYAECPHFFAHYIRLYQTRNQVKAHDNPLTGDFVMYMERIKSLFVVYLDQCIQNADLINEAYEQELIRSSIDYVAYAKEKIAELGSFEHEFLQLHWFNEEQTDFAYDFSTSVKFIGEAGMGKTTQMRAMYLQLLRLVAEGKQQLLPVWIDLSELSELEDLSLEDKIRRDIGEYGQYYRILLKQGIPALFLDGYNEILSKDNQDVVRRAFANDVDEIHRLYEHVLIALTDRSRKSNPPILMKKVNVYTSAGMSMDEIREYIRLKTGGEDEKHILDYVSSADWVSVTTMIPAKLNSLIELLRDGEEPENEDDFYDRYLEYILDREANEKKETQIDDLKYLLYLLTQEMEDSSAEMTRNEIVKLWLPNLSGNLHETNRLLDLAIRLPILVPGSSDKVYRFAYSQYYQKLEAGF